MAWTRITRGKPRVRGVNAKYSGLIDVEIDLNPATPPREWAEFFSRPFAVPTSLSMHPPELAGTTVRLMCPDNELDAYVTNVDARIEAANTFFESQVLPSLEAAEASVQRDRASAQARVADAQRRAEKL
jgi:hypothetical protein